MKVSLYPLLGLDRGGYNWPEAAGRAAPHRVALQRARSNKGDAMPYRRVRTGQKSKKTPPQAPRQEFVWYFGGMGLSKMPPQSNVVCYRVYLEENPDMQKYGGAVVVCGCYPCVEELRSDPKLPKKRPVGGV